MPPELSTRYASSPLIVRLSRDRVDYTFLDDDVGVPCLAQGVGIFVLFARSRDWLDPPWLSARTLVV